MFGVMNRLGYNTAVQLVAGVSARCHCSTCTNRRLPCKYVVAVCNSLNEDPKQPCYLNPRWMLNKHPLFSDALRNLAMSPADHGLAAKEAVAVPSEPGAVVPVRVSYGSTFSVPREHYDKISYPEDNHRRYCDLEYLSKEVVTLGKRSKHQFKLAMAALAATKARLQQSQEGGSPRSDGEADVCEAPDSPQTRAMLHPPASKQQRRTEKENDEALRVNGSAKRLNTVCYSRLQSITVDYSRLQSITVDYSRSRLVNC
jgi:hypothetical protein